MKIQITSFGVPVVNRKIMRMGAAAVRTRPVMESVGMDMRRVQSRIFASQGRRGGGSWQQLAASTRRKKARLGQDPRILFGTHRLYDSVTRKTADSIYKITNDAIDFGSKRPGAFAHQAGIGVPRRPFIKFTEDDKRRWVKMVQIHLVEGFRKVG